ncbi:MAG: extracellular solute-binding protein [Chloroflexi bacterium]|nr:extracellular solute-binding protein [Chloroflexota bacterium]MCI0576530.1 extracellular solute-binding protein [Chloroflexota bacterium]MCI0648798.1 extracellular solute-binding protein [Chloroflexota bacterium]MCI0726883.1 extracellular solute-binding protein [Chloroflexota bacterium]
MTRVRNLIILALLLSAALIACAPQQVEVTRVVTQTEVVTEQVEVTRVIEVEGEQQVVTEQIEVTRIVEVAPEESRPFEGVEVNVVTFTGPQIAEPLQRRGPEFEALTGARINVITVPFAELYQSILTDLATGTNSYDAFVFAPQWMVDYIVPGYMEDITERVEADEAIEWEDIAPFFRDFSSTFNGRIYTIPLDGDFHMVYYRTDVFEAAGLEPPRTWDEYLTAAAALHGQDMNGDGEADYGSCIAKARGEQGYWWIISVASGYLQSQGTSQGLFFDTETMAPLVNNAGFIRALEIYKETTNYGPPDELNIGVGDTRALFTSGRCALTLDWGDIGTLAIDPEQSVVQDKVGSVVLPGATEVVDRATGELVPCDETTCPHAVDGVNHAPFASFGGWAGGINAASPDEVKDAAYAFFSYLNQPAQSNIDVTIGRTGFNPYRTSQFLNRQDWVEAGMSPAAAADYLGAIENSLNSPNMVLDLRIPQNQRYEQVVLDTVLSQFLAGELTAEEAAQAIYDQWEEITEELGREDQLAAYLSTIGADN